MPLKNQRKENIVNELQEGVFTYKTHRKGMPQTNYTKGMKNEQIQNQELWSNDEQSKEPMNQLRQNPGWHLNDVKLNKVTMKMNRIVNGIPLMRNLGKKRLCLHRTQDGIKNMV